MKEMEKMKNKREEKRAQNSEMRIKRAQVPFLGSEGKDFATGLLNGSLACNRDTVLPQHF